MSQQLRKLISFPLLLLSVILYSPQQIASAQIIPDNTLGLENSRVNQINQLKSLIEGGAIRGDNLFHSFSEFNINNGQSAYFANPNGINNILSRVTGNNISQIFGTLGVNGNANLFLLNPNGFVFGENASLDLNGSFTVTTGSISFGNQGVFDLNNLPQGNLLNVTPEATFNNMTGSIANQASLVVKDGQNIVLLADNVVNEGQLLSGGDLEILGKNVQLTGTLAAQQDLKIIAQESTIIQDTETKAFQGVAGEDLLVQGNQNIFILTLNNPDSGFSAGRNLTLRSGNPVTGDAYFWSGGNFRVEDLNGDLSFLASFTNSPIIRTQGDVLLGAYKGESLQIIAGGKVKIPNFIWITGGDVKSGLQETITTSDGQQIAIDGKNKATIDIRAGVDPDFIRQPNFAGDLINNVAFSPNPTSAFVMLGTVIFRDTDDIDQRITGDAFISNQYQPNSTLNGNINIGDASTFGSIDTGADLDGGRVTIDSRRDINLAGSIVGISNGKGGEVTLNSFGNLNLFGGAINTTSQFGGNLTINTNNLMLDELDRNGTKSTSFISAGIDSITSTAQSQGGNIDINARGDVTLVNNSFINNSLLEGSQGRSGDIQIDANKIEVVEGSFISSLLNSSGNSGNLTFNAKEIVIDGAGQQGTVSSIQSNSFNGKGKVGNIEVNTQTLTISNGGQLVSDILNSESDGGQITVNASKEIIIGGEFKPSPEQIPLSSNIGSNIGNLDLDFIVNNQAGSIILNTPLLKLDQGARMQSSTFGSGNAGSIILNTENIILSGARSDGFPSFIDSSLQTGFGRGGDIEITTKNLELRDGSLIQASTFGEGDAGMINIQAESILARGESLDQVGSFIDSSVGSNTKGKGGLIEIETKSLELRDGAQIKATTSGFANAGNVIINAEEIILDGADSREFPSGLSTQSNASTGNAGNLVVNAQSLVVKNEASIDSATFAQGNGGTITLNIPQISLFRGSIGASVEPSSTQTENGVVTGGEIIINSESISMKNLSFIQANTSGIGDGGNIRITSDSISLKDGSQIAAGVFGIGNGGNINLTVNEVLVDGEIQPSNIDTQDPRATVITTTISEEGVGNAGRIKIDASNLKLINGGQITSGSFGQGNGGQVLINADNIIVDGESNVENIGSAIATSIDDAGVGNAGETIISTENLTLSNGGFIASSIRGKGNGNNVAVTAKQIVIDGQSSKGRPSSIRSNVAPNSEGNGGEIKINSESLTLTNRGEITASNRGIGNSGNIIVTTENLELNNNSSLTVAIGSQAQAFARGNIKIKTDKISLNNRAFINARSNGRGDGGSIEIQTKTPLILNNRAEISSSLGESGIGEGGSITINSPTLLLDNLSKISASTNGRGNGGFIRLSIGNQLKLDNRSSVTTAVEENGVGVGGQIVIESPLITLKNTSELRASTLGRGEADSIRIDANQLNLLSGSKVRTDASSQFDEANAGNIIINLQEQLLVQDQGSGLFANTSSLSLGDGGNIRIAVPSTILENDSAIAVNSQGAGIGGNVELNSDRVTLNDSQITATTVNTDGGNITVNALETLSLFNSSDITATAGTAQAGGDGGNVEINVPILFSFPAQPFNDITANAFTGEGGNIEITTQAIFGGEFLNISASSQLGLDGEIIINDLEVDPTSGLVIIDANFVDVEGLIALNPCQELSFREGQGSQFIIKGRGGIPAQTYDLLDGSLMLTPWLELTPQDDDTNSRIPTLRKQVSGNSVSGVCQWRNE